MLDPKYRHEIINMPPGLEKHVMLVLMEHVGRENAITRNNRYHATASGNIGALSLGLVTEVNKNISATDRQIRKAISDLRKKGFLIASAAGENGGYFIPASMEEFREFLDSEFSSRITDLRITSEALRKSALEYFGKYSQKELI